jgi:ubiquitin-protein ligase
MWRLLQKLEEEKQRAKEVEEQGQPVGQSCKQSSTTKNRTLCDWSSLWEERAHQYIQDNSLLGYFGELPRELLSAKVLERTRAPKIWCALAQLNSLWGVLAEAVDSQYFGDLVRDLETKLPANTKLWNLVKFQSPKNRILEIIRNSARWIPKPMADKIYLDLMILDNSDTSPVIKVFIPEFIDRWQIWIRGKPGTPFEGGKFLFHFNFPEEYPKKAPKVRAKTKIYHPNLIVSEKFQHSTLLYQWDTRLGSAREVISIAQSGMQITFRDFPAESEVMNEWMWHREEYERKCREWVKLYAMEGLPEEEGEEGKGEDEKK